ncbi:MAG: hypothetical protein J6W76_02555, partial [Spirochaetales bacterium]|nr:hypothetical protein [Spirochaetales bacterium]
MSLLVPGIFLAVMSSLILCFTTDFINLNSKYLLFFSVALLLMLSGVLMICQGSHGEDGRSTIQDKEVQPQNEDDPK